MEKVKTFIVTGDSAHRDVAELVQKRVNDELKSTKKVTDVSFQADLSTVYGKVFVAIRYQD